MNVEVEEVRFPSGELELYGRLRTPADDAPTIILLCGIGFHTFEYEPLATWLAAGGVNCLSFDYRGHGRSGGARGSWTLPELVTDTRRAIDLVRRNHPGPIDLFGNSLGAMVGILAGAEDHRVRSVVASNCPARIADFLLTRPRRMLFAIAKAAAFFVPLRFSVNHFYSYDQLIADQSWISTIEHDALIASARRLSVPTYRTLLEYWDGAAAVTALHKPLLLIQGRNDQLQPPRQSQLLYDAANDPREYLLLDTGHLPHLEDTGTVGGVLVDWFARTARSP